MKRILFIAALFFSLSGYSQTLVSSSTTLATATSFVYGNTYRFFYPTTLDTVDFVFDLNVPTKADTIAIQALKVCPVCPVCPPPVVCPPPIVCPPPAAPRLAKSISISGNTVTVTYNTGSPSTFTLTKPIVIQ